MRYAFFLVFFVIILDVYSTDVLDHYLIAGSIYFDYNNNQTQDLDEFGIEGVEVNVGDFKAVSSKDGSYKLRFSAPKGEKFILPINLKYPMLPEDTFITNKVPTNIRSNKYFYKIDYGIMYSYGHQILGMPQSMTYFLNSEEKYPSAIIKGDMDKTLISINKKRINFYRAKIQIHTLAYTFENENSIPIDYVDIDGLNLKLSFKSYIADRSKIKSWKFIVYNSNGKQIYTYKGFRFLPYLINWDGKDSFGKFILKNQIYRYQLAVRYKNGNEAWSRLRYLVTGGEYLKGFKLAYLPDKKLHYKYVPELLKIERILRKHKDAKLIIEGPKTFDATNFLKHIGRYLAKRKAFKDRMKIFQYREHKKVLFKIMPFPRVQFKDSKHKVTINDNDVQVFKNGQFRIVINEHMRKNKTILRVHRKDGLTLVYNIDNQELSGLGANSDSINLATPHQYVSAQPSIEEGRLYFNYFIAGHAVKGSKVYLGDKATAVDTRGYFKLPIKVEPGKNSYGLEIVRHKKIYYRGAFQIMCTPTPYRANKNNKAIFVAFLPHHRSAYSGEKMFIWGYSMPNSIVKIGKDTFITDQLGRYYGLLSLRFTSNLYSVKIMKPEIVFSYELNLGKSQGIKKEKS